MTSQSSTSLTGSASASQGQFFQKNPNPNLLPLQIFKRFEPQMRCRCPIIWLRWQIKCETWCNDQTRHDTRSTSLRNPEDRRDYDTQYQSGYNAKKVSYVFKMKDLKYNGVNDENIVDFITQYELVSRDLGLPPAEMLQYLHNLFRGEALRDYNPYVSATQET